MLSIPLVLAALITAADAKTPGPICLSDADMRAAVADKRVVAPAVALRAARTAAGGETIRARLCRQDSELVYVITALHRDGAVRRIVVDGRSGRVTSAP